MEVTKKSVFLIFFLLLVLFLRDTPYINVYIIDKVWILYIALFFVAFPPRSIFHLVILTLAFLIIAYIFTLLKFLIIAEIFGMVIYFVLVVVIILKIYLFISDLRKTGNSSSQE